jgi:hypothetical protein
MALEQHAARLPAIVMPAHEHIVAAGNPTHALTIQRLKYFLGKVLQSFRLDIPRLLLYDTQLSEH